MSLQGRRDFAVHPFFLSGDTLSRDNETLLQDAGRATALLHRTLMGRVSVSVPTTGTADAGNAGGTGTVTNVALMAGRLPKSGTWTLECTVAVANGGTFKLTDPGADIVRNNLVMAAGAGVGTTFYLPEVGLTFTITDGATDFSVGEKFTIAVTAVNKWVPFDASAVDGRQIPRGIFFSEDVPAASLVAGDVTGQVIIVAGAAATFDDSLLVIEGGSTLATVLPGGETLREALYALGFYAQGTIDVSNLEN